MNVLVTGHTGFIGSNMFSFLNEKNSIEVIGYSKSTGGDIFDLNQLMNVVKDCDLVYHFAAYAKPGESVYNPVHAIETNVKGCLNVLEACRKHNVSLIYPSSCEIYGNSIEPIKEEAPIKPLNPYAASKAAADRICFSYNICYDLDVKIVRFFNPYGPNQQLNKIIPALYSQAIINKNLPVFGKEGKDTRDYVYISDIVNGLWLARNLISGEVINLATGRATTNLEIANLILELTGSNSEISFVDYPKEFGNIKNQVGSFEKAKKEIGWYPKVRLEVGVEKTIDWLGTMEV
ncbi:MAG: NAD-dependent epimerase/dehydratase family protein [Halobacteriota archaeon]|nr:NAD-dependent epimerase/dehydratase family protein [Halobacteriota archaeon]